MLSTFNCGLGMVVAIDPAHVEKSLAVVEKSGLEALRRRRRDAAR